MPAKARNLDMSNVKEGGGKRFKKVRQPEGDYEGEILDVSDHKAKDSGRNMWLFSVKAGRGIYPVYCGFNDNELWKIRNMHLAAGMKPPKSAAKVDPNVLVGKKLGVTLEDDEYDGKDQSSVSDFVPLSEIVRPADTDDEEMADEPKKKTKKGKSKKSMKVDKL